MYTRKVIAVLVGALFLVCLGILAALIASFGWAVGLIVGVGLLVVANLVYFALIKPWHMRWGATDEEVEREMPGDDVLPDSKQSTRAVTIAATAEDVWPWLTQIGYGKAGWYSYDWIDNDFEPSVSRLMPIYQQLEVGDQILMMPGIGFDVHAVDEPHSIVSVRFNKSGSWCLALYPTEDERVRLISRWRPHFDIKPSTALMAAFSEPGTFIMERKMLLTIRDLVEAHHSANTTGG